MKIKDIYRKLDKIGCLTFATIDNGYPETRIAHFVAYDDDGLYFMTMRSKPFYKQLKDTNKVSVCGMSSSTNVGKDENGLPTFEPGYTARVTGDIKEISFEEVKEKSKTNELFIAVVKDIEKYNDMTTFCIYRGKFEIFDYDFEKITRENKIYREVHNFGGFETKFRGVKIDDKCIRCGICYKKCSFDAIIPTKEGPYDINFNRCDVCGSCILACPKNAITSYK